MPARGACHALMKETAERHLDRMWRVIDGHLAQSGRYLLGSSFSAADIFLTMLTRWSRNCAKPAWIHPAMGRPAERVKIRPTYARMVQEEGITQ
jgi:glutathione S-transferase